MLHKAHTKGLEGSELEQSSSLKRVEEGKDEKKETKEERKVAKESNSNQQKNTHNKENIGLSSLYIQPV